jgi:hypothetical protein
MTRSAQNVVASPIKDSVKPPRNIAGQGRNGAKSDMQVPQDDSEMLWDAMTAAGKAATKRARSTLADAGVGAVVERNGVLLELLPDGSSRRLSPGDLPGDA